MKKKLKYLFATLTILLSVGLVTIYSIDNYVQRVGLQNIVDAKDVPKADAILVLGAFVFPDGSVSLMLNDRLNMGYELYKAGKSQRILVSGDHGLKEYDEVNTMKGFLKDKGVPSHAIFMDHAGFNTYQSIYRARDIFQVKKIIIVTQEYHLKRALFIARELGLEAYGVASDQHNYGEVMKQYQLREIAARNKDFFTARLIQPKPTYLGEVIPVFGDGKDTDDK